MAFLVGLGEVIAQSPPQADDAWLPGATRANGFVSARTEPNVSDGVSRARELIRFGERLGIYGSVSVFSDASGWTAAGSVSAIPGDPLRTWPRGRVPFV
jgi:hypothetical protein